MLSEYENRIELSSKPLLDIDVSGLNTWVAISESEVLSPTFRYVLPVKFQFPTIRILSDDQVVVVDSRTQAGISNGFILDSIGSIVSSFYAGDAIEDVVVSEDHIVITYFDEAFCATGVESNGVSVFDKMGNFQFGYRGEFGAQGEDVFDCYACTLISQETVMFYCYTQFPLVMLDLEKRTQQVLHPPASMAGSHAITQRGNRVYFHGPYNDKRGIYEWKMKSDSADKVGAYTSHLRGLPNGRFLSKGERADIQSSVWIVASVRSVFLQFVKMQVWRHHQRF